MTIGKMPRLLSSLLLSALLTVAPTNAFAAAQDTATRLVGTWRLVAATQRMADGTERPDPNVGAKPRGYIIYTQTGQVCAMLANTERHLSRRHLVYSP